MNPLKAQVKIGTINELGNKFEDVKESASKTISQQEGYGIALTDFEGSVQSILEKIDAERDEGQYDLETANLLKKTIMRVQNAVQNLKVRQQKHLLLAQGQVLGIDLIIKHTKKALDVEMAKVKDPSESTETTAHARPDTPSSALADIEQRRAEAKAAKAAAEAKAADAVKAMAPKAKTTTKKTTRKKVASRKG